MTFLELIPKKSKKKKKTVADFVEANALWVIGRRKLFQIFFQYIILPFGAAGHNCFCFGNFGFGGSNL